MGSFDVKYLCLKDKFQNIIHKASLENVFNNANFILGKEVEIFEQRFASFCNVKHAIGVNSGTDAIFLALKALGVGSGDEVISVPNSFIATAGAVVATGATPVFVDVGRDYNINPYLIESVITKRTKAILPVHLTGNPAELDVISNIASKYNLSIVEDAAQAVGAVYRLKKVGSFGIGCFSLHPLKNLNVCGDGGVITTDSDDIFEKIRLLRNHGLINRDEAIMWGYNSRLDTIQAAIALQGLDELEQITEKRIKNALLYDELLSDLEECIILPPRRDYVRQVFHTYVIEVEKRNELILYLKERGVETKIHYPIPIHLQKAAEVLGYKKGDFPICEEQSRRIISFPIHQYLKEDDILRISEYIHKFYGK